MSPALKGIASLVFAVLAIVLVSACSLPLVTPQSTGEAHIDAYRVIEHATVLATGLLHADLISVDKAQQILKDAQDGKAAVDLAGVAVGSGDLTGAEEQLRLAKAIIDRLAEFSTANEGRIAP